MDLLVSNGFIYIKCYKCAFLGLRPIFTLFLRERKDMKQLEFLLEQIVSNFKFRPLRNFCNAITPYNAYSAVGFHPELNAQCLEDVHLIKCSNDEFERLVGYLSINFPQKIIWND